MNYLLKLSGMASRKDDDMDVMKEKLKSLEDKIKAINEEINKKANTVKVKPILPTGFLFSEVPKFENNVCERTAKDHLRKFEEMMHLRGVDQSLYASVFPFSLNKEDLSWFYSLPVEEIKSLEYITQQFFNRFICWDDFEL